MAQKSVVSIGEVMVVMRPDNYERLEHARHLRCIPGGAEVNVCVGLSRLGVTASWIGKLPDHPMSRNIINRIRGQGVDVSRVILTRSGRLGVMYVELGFAPRQNYVVYDRDNTAVSTMSVEEIDWEFVCSHSHLHLTGITPALSPSCLEVTKYAIRRARRANMTISFDVNYRSQLWSPQEAREVLSPILREVDVLIISATECEFLFDCSIDLTSEENVQRFAADLREKLCIEVLLLKRGQSPPLAATANGVKRGVIHEAVILNRLGVGDAFNAGFLFGYLEKDVEKGLEYGAIAASNKLVTLDENFPLFTLEEIENTRRKGSGKAKNNYPVQR